MDYRREKKKKRNRRRLWSVQLCFTFSRLWCAVNLMSENRPDRLWLDVRHVPPIGVGPCAVPWKSCTGVEGRIHGHNNIQPFNSHPHPSHPRKRYSIPYMHGESDPRKYWAWKARRWKMTSNTLCAGVSISVTHVWLRERKRGIGFINVVGQGSTSDRDQQSGIFKHVRYER